MLNSKIILINDSFINHVQKNIGKNVYKKNKVLFNKLINLLEMFFFSLKTLYILVHTSCVFLYTPPTFEND